ncbi:MAG: hypothetical protein PF542_00185 [Nanoarchaeota archaeon]|jgi:hypothetical protein|nr:hypothetical protein [Nanoarchaeota archaeon]
MKIDNERKLMTELKKDIDNTSKKNIIILAGHFPLIYTTKGAIEAIHRWGEFSPYTLELGCKIGKYAKQEGKDIKFVFFVDDHIYEELCEVKDNTRSTFRRNLYRKKSKKDAKPQENFEKIMKKYEFSEKDIIRQNQNKKGRESSIYFSEKILRAKNVDILNACAREYTTFIEDKKYFNKQEDYIIAFIPNRCKENICEVALDIEIKDLSSTHIFMDSSATLSTREELYSFGRGVNLRRD